jgi:hypothetical protein
MPKGRSKRSTGYGGLFLVGIRHPWKLQIEIGHLVVESDRQYLPAYVDQSREIQSSFSGRTVLEAGKCLTRDAVF